MNTKRLTTKKQFKKTSKPNDEASTSNVSANYGFPDNNVNFSFVPMPYYYPFGFQAPMNFEYTKSRKSDDVPDDDRPFENDEDESIIEETENNNKELSRKQ